MAMLGKRAATEPIEQVLETNMNNTGGQGSGGAGIGGSAIPTKTETTDGTIDFTANISHVKQNELTITYTGITWLGNTNLAGNPDSNLWASFAWEFPSLFTNFTDAEAFNQWRYFKPKSVVCEFGDPYNYTQINTGTTPFMIPNGHQKVYGLMDIDNAFGTSDAPFGIGEIHTAAGPTNTRAQLQSVKDLVRSFTNGGYAPIAGTDQQAFLPNVYQIDPTVAGFSLSARSFGGIQNPHTKTMRIGSGHGMRFQWNYTNLYWRSVKQLLAWPYNYTPPTATATSAIYSFTPRLDEIRGMVQLMTAGGTNNPTLSSYFAAQNFTTPDTSSTLGSLYSSSIAGPSLTTINLTSGERLWFPFSSWHPPQPKLLLHLQPDIGVVGTTGTSNCQLGFKVSWTFQMMGRLTQGQARYDITTDNLASGQPNPDYFTPIYTPLAIGQNGYQTL